MQVVRGIRPGMVPASVVTLGMFDGVHRGHVPLLQECRRHADMLGLPAILLTYTPHPLQVLRPDLPVRLLTPLEERLQRLAAFALDTVVVVPFTQEFSLLTPAHFIRDVVCQALQPALVVAGYRTTFGHDREGTAASLRELGGRCRFKVEIVPPVEVEAQPVSSTRIRERLAAGDVDTAAELLGYAYQVTGIVVAGDGRGTALGLPTANLAPPPDKLIPGEGVYAVAVAVGDTRYRGVMSIGTRPTFNRPATLEVHLLDYAGDLYGREITITFRQYLREIRAFSTPEALVNQIYTDIARARALPE